MAYNAGVQYRGDMYMYQAIANLGEQAGKAFTQYRQDRAKSQFLDTKLQGLLRAAQQAQGLVDPSDPQMLEQVGGVVDELGRLGKMSLSQKEALAGDIEFRLANLMQAGAQRQQSRQGQAYFNLQERNTKLNEEREQRQVTREANRDAANRRFILSLAEPKSVPDAWTGTTSVSPQVRPEGQERTVDDFLRAAAEAGPGLEPKDALGIMEAADPARAINARAALLNAQANMKNAGARRKPEAEQRMVEVAMEDPVSRQKSVIRVPWDSLTPEQQARFDTQLTGTKPAPFQSPLTTEAGLTSILNQLAALEAGGETSARITDSGEVVRASWLGNDTSIATLKQRIRAALAEVAKQGGGAAPASQGQPGGARAGIKITREK